MWGGRMGRDEFQLKLTRGRVVATPRITGSSKPGARSRDFDKYRGARIRTGDLCVPNAALYRTEPRPGEYRTTYFELTSPSARSVSLRSAQTHSALFFEERVGSNPPSTR